MPPQTKPANGEKRIMLTGSIGVMGSAGLKELMRRHDRFDLTLLVRNSRKNRRLMVRYRSVDGVRIIWGGYDDVRASVDGADYILHIGGMVSPMADRYPGETMEVNIHAAENIVRAVKAQPDVSPIARPCRQGRSHRFRYARPTQRRFA